MAAVVCWAMALLAMPAGALAQRGGPERDLSDARVEGYGRVLSIDGSTALSWIFLVVLTLICLAVLFKDARRQHFD